MIEMDREGSKVAIWYLKTTWEAGYTITDTVKLAIEGAVLSGVCNDPEYVL